LIEIDIEIDGRDNNGWNAVLYLSLHYSNENLIDIVDLLIHDLPRQQRFTVCP
jgi:hypothetical protein